MEKLIRYIAENYTSPELREILIELAGANGDKEVETL